GERAGASSMMRFAVAISLVSATAQAATQTPPAAVPTPSQLEKKAKPGALKLKPEEKAKMIQERQKLAAEKRAEAIKLLEELIAMNPGSDAAADGYYKLAELYWEDSRQNYANAMAAYDKKTEKCKEKGTAPDEPCPAPPPRRGGARWEKLYRLIVQKFPGFRQGDVPFSLRGFGARGGGRGDGGVGWLPRLIDQYPQSDLLPD